MLRFLLVPILVLVLLLRGVLWLLFVPLHRLLLRFLRRLGPLRIPFTILTLPIHLVGMLLDVRRGGGRVLEGEVIRPTFTAPFAFVRGKWTVAAEQNSRRALLELKGEASEGPPSSLEICVSPSIDENTKDDPMVARMIEQALADPPLPNGMRWAGVRINTFSSELTCLYLVWKDDAPDGECVRITFKGSRAHEADADEFVSSVLPELPAPVAANPEPA